MGAVLLDSDRRSSPHFVVNTSPTRSQALRSTPSSTFHSVFSFFPSQLTGNTHCVCARTTRICTTSMFMYTLLRLICIQLYIYIYTTPFTPLQPPIYSFYEGSWWNCDWWTITQTRRVCAFHLPRKFNKIPRQYLIILY